MQSRKGTRALLTPYLGALIAALTLSSSTSAYADLLLESDAGRARLPAFAAALQLRLGTIKGTRDRKTHADEVRRYHGAFGVALRYRFLYLVPELEVQYVEIETTRTDGQLRRAKLRSKGGLAEGEAFKNLAVGGTLGAALPASVMRGFAALQPGVFVDGRTTLVSPSLSFDELVVVYKGHNLNMEEQGNSGALKVNYRWWTLAWGGFLNLRMEELPRFWSKTPLLRPIGRALQRSVLSVSGGMLHFRLNVDVEVDKSFEQYVEGDQSQRISKDRLFLRTRYAVPLTGPVGVEIGGSATRKNGDWLYEADALLSVRF